MKKFNILLMGASLMVMGMLTTSCGEDFLEVTPDNDYTADTYYSSDQAVLKAMEPVSQSSVCYIPGYWS